MQNLEDLTVFIDKHGDELATDSRAVALAFGRKHQHVLRTIRGMLKSGHPEISNHAASNFGLSEYADTTGRTLPMYRMTAKGLSELAMSFTGDKSRVIRIRFINAFEEVADRLARAERTITEMLHDLERREAPSKIKGRIGSKLMNERKVEKRELAFERTTLMEKAQPGLFLN